VQGPDAREEEIKERGGRRVPRNRRRRGSERGTTVQMKNMRRSAKTCASGGVPSNDSEGGGTVEDGISLGGCA